MPTSNPTPRGFTALISVVIVSVVLLMALLAVAYRGLSDRFVFLNLERKMQSERWAEGCVQVARVAIQNDPLYNPDEFMVRVGEGSCSIRSIEHNSPTAGFSQIQAQASSSGATTNLRAVIDISNSHILSVLEISN